MDVPVPGLPDAVVVPDPVADPVADPDVDPVADAVPGVLVFDAVVDPEAAALAGEERLGSLVGPAVVPSVPPVVVPPAAAFVVSAANTGIESNETAARATSDAGENFMVRMWRCCVLSQLRFTKAIIEAVRVGWPLFVELMPYVAC
jgi:hypothetical protein